VTIEPDRADLDDGICLWVETGGLDIKGYD
jgi:hypothetical protein